jgi:hypothetical protein
MTSHGSVRRGRPMRDMMTRECIADVFFHAGRLG